MSFLQTVYDKAAVLEVVAGRVVLIPKNGDQDAADQWLSSGGNHDRLLKEICNKTKRQALLYDRYSTGCYLTRDGDKRAGGLTLQFIEVVTGREVFAIFNAEVKRTRNTKYGAKGSMLPKGRFSVGRRSAFVAFWQRVQLDIPRRLCEFPDCMGKLRKLAYAGSWSASDKIDNPSLVLLEIPANEIGAALSVPASPKSHSVPVVASGIRAVSDSRTHERQPARSDSSSLSTAPPWAIALVDMPDPPAEQSREQQSIDDWLADYDREAG